MSAFHLAPEALPRPSGTESGIRTGRVRPCARGFAPRFGAIRAGRVVPRRLARERRSCRQPDARRRRPASAFAGRRRAAGARLSDRGLHASTLRRVRSCPGADQQNGRRHHAARGPGRKMFAENYLFVVSGGEPTGRASCATLPASQTPTLVPTAPPGGTFFLGPHVVPSRGFCGAQRLRLAAPGVAKSFCCRERSGRQQAARATTGELKNSRAAFAERAWPKIAIAL